MHRYPSDADFPSRAIRRDLLQVAPTATRSFSSAKSFRDNWLQLFLTRAGGMGLSMPPRADTQGSFRLVYQSNTVTATAVSIPPGHFVLLEILRGQLEGQLRDSWGTLTSLRHPSVPTSALLGGVYHA